MNWAAMFEYFSVVIAVGLLVVALLAWQYWATDGAEFYASSGRHKWNEAKVFRSCVALIILCGIMVGLV